MLQRLGIRGKLLMVVAVPTIVLLLAASVLVFNSASTYSSGRNTSQLVSLIGVGQPLVAAIQTERADSSAYLRAVNDGNADVVLARTNVDTSVAALRKAGESDPAFAPIADAIMVAVAGANGGTSLDDAREVTAIGKLNGEFPAWLDSETVQPEIDVFFQIASQVAEAANSAPVNDTGALARSLAALIRNEGTTTQGYLADSLEGAETLPADVESVDRAAAAFASKADNIRQNSGNEAVLARIASATAGLTALSDVRLDVRGGTIQTGVVQDAYTQIITDLLGGMAEIANATDDRGLAKELDGVVAMGQLSEAMRQEEVYVARKVGQGYWRQGESVQFQAYYFGSNNALVNAIDVVSQVPGIGEVPEFGASYDRATVNGYGTIRDRLFNDSTDRALLDQRQNDWELQVDEEVAAFLPIIGQLSSAVSNSASTIERNSLIQMLATIIIAVAVFALTLIITQAIARRIINPLRRLTTTATAVRQELPRLVERVAMPGQSVDVSEVQIPVESQDEVGRLAEAFNSVNAATLSIAAEQAALRGSISEMFVNVARRDQVLLNRQLASIDEMERTEDNQSTLTKLFALDHLATRMRRNSESLLVLAGIDTGRRLRRSMPLSDVIRTASSEIELYERVELELDADPSMLGHSALTAAHLFAELLENATVFSDPGTKVIVRTMERDGGFVVSVTDSGIGMTREELAEANSRVASTAASEILGAQRLGLFVVGRIARRVGARVHLDSGEGQGTEATVVMPQSLFDPNVGSGHGHVNATTVDETLKAPAALVHQDPTNEEITEPALSKRGLSAYQPTVIEQGKSLSERAGEADSPEPSPLASRVAPVSTPEPQGLNSNDIGNLVAADAAEAPAAVPVNLQELTGGMTEVGLPTRRRRAPAGPEAGSETNSIIALPQRASEAQLSALQGAATTGFTPILAAHEVSPETAEARSRVFRGFRPLRGNEEEPVAVQPDAESLGHAVRRGAPAAETAVEADVSRVGDSGTTPEHVVRPTAPFAPVAASQVAPEPVRPESVRPEPVMRPTAPVVPVAASPVAPEPVRPDSQSFQPVEAANDRSFDVMRNFAAEEADRRDGRVPIVRQSPLIQSGYVEDSAEDAEGATPIAALSAGMLVPQLEDYDDEDAPPVRERTFRTPSLEPDEDAPAGVTSVSLNEAPAPVASVAAAQSAPQNAAPVPSAAPYAPQNAAPVPSAAAYRSPLYPAPATQSAPQEPRFESDPVASVPSLDELIMDGAGSAHSEYRGGFFSRLFGKSGKASEPTVHPAAPSTPGMTFGPVGEPKPAVKPASPWLVLADESQAQPTKVEPPPAPTPEPRPEPVYYAANPDHEWPAAAPDHEWPSAAPVPERPEAPAEVAQRAPEPAAGQFAPLGGASPAGGSDAGPQWTMLPPSMYAAPAAGATSVPTPRAEHVTFDSLPPQEPANAFTSHDSGTTYSPDQLARPMGWEAAGASALQAAAPESATSYRPVVQITPEAGESGDQDYASAVFSELSSLAAERPKVEKTRAGLQKRTPVAREEVAPEPEHHEVQLPRDAEAVRTRFSAFYSGTQRARDDAQNLSGSTQDSLTES